MNWTGGPYYGNSYVATGSVTGVGTPPENLGHPGAPRPSTATGTPLSGAPKDTGAYTVSQILRWTAKKPTHVSSVLSRVTGGRRASALLHRVRYR